MPKRQSTRRVDCSEVQGEDSFAVLRNVPYQLVREAQQKLDSDTGTMKNAQEGEEFTIRLLKASVVEWNWVDDDGEALPLPSSDEFDLGDLLLQEVTFLSEAIMGDESLKK